ncbi:MAG: ABC-F family ATP-binding cassette domain-containing protein [Caldilineaceae bacterium]|nr:ABC-F family ATP-binding cassette domain-containing protein [Caldilineaceae bacterium]
MSLIRLLGIAKKYENQSVLREVFFRLATGDRVGLIGKNGAGKTTVLRLILGQEEQSAGVVELAPDIRIGYFSQFSQLQDDLSLQQVLNGLFAAIDRVAQELHIIEEALPTTALGAETERLLARYAELVEQMNREDGWTYQHRIDTVLTQLGFRPADRVRPIQQLSGGWRNRAALAKILLEAPDVLLLDEPTNFLDVAGLTWLEEWLVNWRGAVLIVSHDRHFLDQVVNRIIEIENYHFQEYEGNFTQYIRKRQLRHKTLERQFQYEEDLLAFEAEAITDRRQARQEPSQALLQRRAEIKKRSEPKAVDTIITDLYAGLSVRNELCQVEKLTKGYTQSPLFQQLSFTLQRGDRLAIIGPNGSGKSTLLKLLRGDEQADVGSITWLQGSSGATDDPAFADYNQMLATLDPTDIVSHAVNVSKLAFFEQRKKVEKFLALLRFAELEQRQRIGTLSGGQQARVALALCLLSGAPVLLLDEPTNHLDLTSTQVMERALLHFPGAVIFISHDRFFLDKVATRLLIFDHVGGTQLFEGNWSMWQGASGQEAR